MEAEAPQLSFLSFVVPTIFTIIVLIVPIWIIFKKSGQNPAWSLFIFFPFPLGLWIVCSILAFSHWPAVCPKANAQKQEKEEI